MDRIEFEFPWPDQIGILDILGILDIIDIIGILGILDIIGIIARVATGGSRSPFEQNRKFECRLAL